MKAMAKDPGQSGTAPRSDVMKTIHVRGAREHNLKNIDLEVPRDALVVFTVVSTAHRELLRRLCDEENVDAVDLYISICALGFM